MIDERVPERDDRCREWALRKQVDCPEYLLIHGTEHQKEKKQSVDEVTEVDEVHVPATEDVVHVSRQDQSWKQE